MCIRDRPDRDQPVNVLVVKGAIFTSTANYISRGIKQAEADGAICVIEMDTPGGLIQSMRDIIQNILAADIPVIVYVYPSGAMATSAGTYITYASHVAAMAPGTHIGSAHPIGIGYNNKRWKSPDEDPFNLEKIRGIKKSPEPDKEKEEEENLPGSEVDVGLEKATNAMVALIRSLAEKNNRNADWGEKAVRESVSITAKEAKKMKVVEIEANDLSDLLDKLDGRKITLKDNRTVILHPSKTNVKYVRMTGIEHFLLVLNDPQIAIILMLLGTVGLYYELAHPGATVPGIIGGICIILGLYTLGSLPINYTALALIVLSVILFIAELFTPTFGAFTLGGVISFILGAIFLVPAGMPYLRISKALIITLGITMGAISLLIVSVVVKSYRKKPFSGKEGLIGNKAIVKTDLAPEGMILLNGELWKAVSTSGTIPKGRKVIVEKADGLTVSVREYHEDQKKDLTPEN